MSFNRPNQLTTLRILLTPVFVYLLMQETAGYVYLASAVYMLACFTDWYDGWVARRYGYVTEIGKFLDPLADKVLVISGFLSFVVLDFLPLWMVLVIIGRDMVITGLRFYASTSGKSITTSTIAKWKTFSQMGLSYLVLFGINVAATTGVPVRAYVLAGDVTLFGVIYNAALLVTVFTLLTGLHYLLKNRDVLKALFWRCFRVFSPSDL